VESSGIHTTSDNQMFIASIGHVCVQYANLETNVALIIWALLGIDADEWISKRGSEWRFRY
jgi:hypothetical protein